MAKALPVELRERVVQGVEEKELSIAAAADLYAVGTATVKRWLARARATGSVEPSAMGGMRVVLIALSEEQRVVDLVERMPDATVEELAAAYTEQYGTVLSRSSMTRALKRFGITRKKKASGLPRRRRLA